MSRSDRVDGERPVRASRDRPTRRRVVGLYVLLAVLGITALIVLTTSLRLDQPLTGPPTPEVAGSVDTLRNEVTCELEAGREGEDREQAMAEPALPEEVTSNELYDCPQTWDGRRIRYTGEVVGALLDRRDAVWAQLNDDVYGDPGAPLPTHRDYRGGNAGIGVLLGPGMAEVVEWVGGPGIHGDVLEVLATFHRVDEGTGEVAILRAEEVRVVRRGAVLEHADGLGRPVAALLAAAAAAVIVAVERRTRERR